CASSRAAERPTMPAPMTTASMSPYIAVGERGPRGPERARRPRARSSPARASCYCASPGACRLQTEAVMAEAVHKSRCQHCRPDIVVPESYHHGDHIKCGSCGMRHKVSRGEVLRLVLADVAPLKEALQANRTLVDRLEADLRSARGSFGIGVN